MESCELMECPYNKSHMIYPDRMPYHLMKCRKNFPSMDLVVCPFNASHEVHKAELKYHMLHCPSRVLLEKEVSFEAILKAQIGADLPLKKGYTELPRYRDHRWDHSDEQENWDIDMNPRNFTRSARFTRDNHRRDSEHSLRWPVSHGRAGELSISMEPGVRQPSVTSPQSALDSNVFCMGRGRARPSLLLNPGTSTPEHVFQPNVMSSMSMLRLGLPPIGKTIGRGQCLLSTDTHD